MQAVLNMDPINRVNGPRQGTQEAALDRNKVLEDPLLTWEFEDPLALLPWVSRKLPSHITESLVPTE